MKQKGVTAEAIRKQLPKVVTSYSGATGVIKWDDYGQRIDPPIEYLEYKQGKFAVIDVRN